MSTAPPTVFRVSRDANVHKLAGAIVHALRTQETVYLQAIGAAAVNQSVKAIAIAGSILAPRGVRIFCSPDMVNLTVQHQVCTAVRFKVWQAPMSTDGGKDSSSLAASTNSAN